MHRPDRLVNARRLAPWAALALLTPPIGCGDSESGTAASGPPRSLPAPPPTLGAAPPPPTAEQGGDQVKLRKVIGETTTDIHDYQSEMQGGEARVAGSKIATDQPIAVAGNAYVSIVGQASQMQIQHTLDIYHATNDRYPETLDEFMDEIIRPNGIALPQLPAYQEYAYDSENHRLVVLEYPARKEQLLQQVRGQ